MKIQSLSVRLPAVRSRMVLYFAADLLWASKIKATADALGIPCRPVRTLEMLEARLADSEVRAVLLDLDNPEIALSLLSRLRGPQADEPQKAIRVVAFGPHVAKDVLQTARTHGADSVLTRGALDANLEDVLLKLHSGGRM